MRCKIILISMISSLFLVKELSAQDSLRRENREKFNNLYLFGEFGKTNNNTSQIQGGIALEIQNAYFKIKSSSIIPFYEKDRRHKEDPVPGCYDLDFMIGRSYIFLNRCQFQVGTGFSVVNQVIQHRLEEPGYYSYHNKYSKHYTVGLPMEVRLNVFIVNGIAISCAANGNVNSINSYTSASIGLMVGIF